ncbi:MAG: glycosyltransferase, partial [Patescibacteria group bacterium]
MSRFKVSVIVLSYNTKEILQQCLSALFDSNDIKNYQVIVVDNGSSDGSVETIRNFQTPCLAGRQANPKFQTNSNPPAGGPKIKLIENKKNLG